MSKSKIMLAIAVVAVFVFAAFGMAIPLSDSSDAEGTVVEVDGISYELTDRGGENNTAEGTSISRTKLKAELIIPYQIEHDGSVYHVTAINKALPNRSTKVVTVTIEDNPGLVLVDGFFTGATNLKEASLGEGVALVKNMFRGCKKLETVTLPDSLEAIPEGAFTNCSSLETITLGDNVKYIMDNAFSGCTSLTTINIPDSVEVIGVKAFFNCSNITELGIGPHIRSIGAGAFKGTMFKSFSIPAGLTEIDIGKDCLFDDLDAISIAKENPAFTVENGVVYNKDKSVLLYFPRTITTPDGTFTTSASIGPYAFYGTNLKKVTVSEGAEFIGESAFENCSVLSEVVLPDTVNSIGSGAFKGCSSLSSVRVPSGITEISESMFSGSGLVEVTVSSGVLSIGNSAFSECANLRSVVIEGNVTSIGNSAFSNCVELSSINLPDSVESIGNSAFRNCVKMEAAQLPSSLNSVGFSAFEGCSRFNITSIPANVSEIGNGAFLDTGIVNISVGNGESPLEMKVLMGNHDILNVFGGSALKKVHLDNVTTTSSNVASIIGASPNLTEITLGSHFGLWQWDEDSGLGWNPDTKTAYLLKPGVSKLTIPTYVEKLYGSGFRNNPFLTEVTFAGDASRVITIGSGMSPNSSEAGLFSGCSGLTKVTLPKVVLLDESESGTFRNVPLEELEIWDINTLPARTFVSPVKPDSFSKLILHGCRNVKSLPNAGYIQFPTDMVTFFNAQYLYDSDGTKLVSTTGQATISEHIAGQTYLWKGTWNGATPELAKIKTDSVILCLDYGLSTMHIAVDSGATPDLSLYEHSGLSVSGWYTDPGRTNPYVPEPVTEPITLYASASLAGFTVTYIVGDVPFTVMYGGSVLPSGSVVPAQSNVNVVVEPKEGYFARPYVNGKVSANSPIIRENSIISVEYVANNVTLTFDVVGAEPIANISGKYGDPVEKPGNPVKNGYRFVGWNHDIGDTFPASSTTYVALWTPERVTVTLDSVGGSQMSPVEMQYNSMYGDLPEPTREGHTFAGWCFEDETPVKYEMIAKATADHTLYATWTVNQYTISFNTDGGSAVDAITADYGTNVAAPAAPTRAGHAFLGWDSMPAKVPAADTVVRAVWAKEATVAAGEARVVLRGGGTFIVPSAAENVTAELDHGVTVKLVGASGVTNEPITARVAKVANTSGVDGTAYDLTLEKDGRRYEGTMHVTVPYEEEKGRDPVVYRWDGTNLERMEILSHGDGYLTFDTGHNSVYVVGSEQSPTEWGKIITVALVAVLVVAAAAVLLVGRRQ